VDFKTVSSERFKPPSRWERFKDWFKRVILRRKPATMLDVGHVPVHRLIENQSIKDMDRVEDSQFFEYLKPVRCVRCARPITDFERSAAIYVIGEGLAHPDCLPPGDP